MKVRDLKDALRNASLKIKNLKGEEVSRYDSYNKEVIYVETDVETSINGYFITTQIYIVAIVE